MTNSQGSNSKIYSDLNGIGVFDFNKVLKGKGINEKICMSTYACIPGYAWIQDCIAVLLGKAPSGKSTNNKALAGARHLISEKTMEKQPKEYVGKITLT